MPIWREGVGEKMNPQIHIADMHCHILPGVDDGSRSMEQTISMLKIAYDEGVRLIIATPHYHIGRMMVTQDKIDSAMRELLPVVKKRFPELEIFTGQEVYYFSDAMKMLDEKKIKTMADSQYVLLEYSVDESFEVISSSIYDAITGGYSPILAHIERYICLIDRLDRVEQLIQSGAYIQINANSVSKDVEKGMQKFVKKLLKEKMVHFVSSDAHSDRSRAPRFEETVKRLTKYCGNSYCKDLLWNNANRIINNEEI